MRGQVSLNGVRGKEIRRENRNKIRQRKAERTRRNEKKEFLKEFPNIHNSKIESLINIIKCSFCSVSG